MRESAQARAAAPGGVTIPELWTFALGPGRRKRLVHCAQKLRGLDETVGALRDGDRPLGVVAQGRAGNPEVGGLFLDAAGIGDGDAAVHHEIHELHVAQRLGGA